MIIDIVISIIIGISVIIIVISYTNRLIEIRIKPLILRMNEIEHERNDIETRYTALQQMYQHLQNDFDELLKKYNLLQAWAEGIIKVLDETKQDFPPIPERIKEKRYIL